MPPPFSMWLLANSVIGFGFNALWGYLFGWKAVAWLLFGTLLGMGYHPCAGHFIGEHFEWNLGYDS